LKTSLGSIEILYKISPPEAIHFDTSKGMDPYLNNPNRLKCASWITLKSAFQLILERKSHSSYLYPRTCSNYDVHSQLRLLECCGIKSSANFLISPFPLFFNIQKPIVCLLNTPPQLTPSPRPKYFSERSAMLPLNPQVLKRDLNEGGLIGGIVIGLLGVFLFVVWVSIIFRRRW
jgi:hypothetical protein